MGAQDCHNGVFSGSNDLVEALSGPQPLRVVDYIRKNIALFEQTDVIFIDKQAG